METNYSHIKTIADISNHPEFMLVQGAEVKPILEIIGQWTYEDTIGGLYVLMNNGEYTEVFGFEGEVPYMGKELIDLLHISEKQVAATAALMETNYSHIKTIADISNHPEFMLVQGAEVKPILEIIGQWTYEDTIGGLYVLMNNGEYTEVFGFEGEVPYMGKELIDLLHISEKQVAATAAFKIIGEAVKHGIKASDCATVEEFAEKIFNATHISYGKAYLLVAYHVMKKRNMKQGGSLEIGENKYLQFEDLKIGDTVDFILKRDKDVIVKGEITYIDENRVGFTNLDYPNVGRHYFTKYSLSEHYNIKKAQQSYKQSGSIKKSDFKLNEVQRLIELAENGNKEKALSELKDYVSNYKESKAAGEKAYFGRSIDSIIDEYQNAVEYVANMQDIPNNYVGKTAEQVWDEWTVTQRNHFVSDHNLTDNMSERTLKMSSAQLKADKWGKEFGNQTSWDWISGVLHEHISQGEYKKGGIINQYKGKTAEQVWDEWTHEQKVHFLLDHKINPNADKEEMEHWANKSFQHLTNDIRGVLFDHVMSGQYAKGGNIKQPVNYNKKWKVTYLTFQSTKGTKEIVLGRMSDREDVKQALKRMGSAQDLNIREVLSIDEVMEQGGSIQSVNEYLEEIFNADSFVEKFIYLTTPSRGEHLTESELYDAFISGRAAKVLEEYDPSAFYQLKNDMESSGYPAESEQQYAVTLSFHPKNFDAVKKKIENALEVSLDDNSMLYFDKGDDYFEIHGLTYKEEQSLEREFSDSDMAEFSSQEMAKKGMWIKKALTGNKGALRRTARQRGLLRNMDEKLSMRDLKKLQNMSPLTAKRAHLAETLRKFESGGEVNDWEQVSDEMHLNWDDDEQYPAQVFYSPSKDLFKSVNDKTGTEYWKPKELTPEVIARISDYTGFPASEILPRDIFVANEVIKVGAEESMAQGGEIIHEKKMGVDLKTVVKKSDSNPRKWIFTMTWADKINGNKIWRSYPNYISEYFDTKSEAEDGLNEQLKWNRERNLLPKQLFPEEFKQGGTIPDATVDEVLKHYIMAGLWAETNVDSEDGDDNFEKKYSASDIAPDSLSKMREKVTEFLSENNDAVTSSGLTNEEVGHSLWLTQNHHGAGFFDYSLDADVEKQLTAGAHKLGEGLLEVGDDGKIHIHYGRSMKQGGNINSFATITDYLSSLSDAQLPSAAAAYLRDELLNDNTLNLLSPNDTDVKAIADFISEKFETALPQPVEVGEEVPEYVPPVIEEVEEEPVFVPEPEPIAYSSEVQKFMDEAAMVAEILDTITGTGKKDQKERAKFVDELKMIIEIVESENEQAARKMEVDYAGYLGGKMKQGGGIEPGYQLELKDWTADVYEDSFEGGEGEHVNSFSGEVNKTFGSIEDLLKHIGDHITYEDAKKENFSVNNDGRIDTSVLVDAENSPASESEIEKWKKGELKLYNANYSFEIILVNQQMPTVEELSSLLGIKMKKGGSIEKAPENFRYLTLQQTKNGLKITLNEQGKEFSEEEGLTQHNFSELFEDVQGNSEYVFLDDGGAMGFGLTEAPMITDGYYYEDNSNLTAPGFTDAGNDDIRVFAYMDYQIHDFASKLKENGEVFFQEVSDGGDKMKKGGSLTHDDFKLASAYFNSQDGRVYKFVGKEKGKLLFRPFLSFNPNDDITIDTKYLSAATLDQQKKEAKYNYVVEIRRTDSSPWETLFDEPTTKEEAEKVKNAFEESGEDYYELRVETPLPFKKGGAVPMDMFGVFLYSAQEGEEPVMTHYTNDKNNAIDVAANFEKNEEEGQYTEVWKKDKDGLYGNEGLPIWASKNSGYFGKVRFKNGGEIGDYTESDYEDARSAIMGEFDNEKIDDGFTKEEVEKLATIVHNLREDGITGTDLWEHDKVQGYLTELSATYKNKENAAKAPFGIYGSNGEFYIKDNKDHRTVPSSTTMHWIGKSNKFSNKAAAVKGLQTMLDKLHKEQPGYNKKWKVLVSGEVLPVDSMKRGGDVATASATEIDHVGIDWQSSFSPADREVIEDDVHQHVSEMVKQGFHSGELTDGGTEPSYSGWWSVDIEEDDNDADDRNNEVSEKIREGYTSGYNPNFSFGANVWNNDKPKSKKKTKDNTADDEEEVIVHAPDAIDKGDFNAASVKWFDGITKYASTPAGKQDLQGLLKIAEESSYIRQNLRKFVVEIKKTNIPQPFKKKLNSHASRINNRGFNEFEHQFGGKTKGSTKPSATEEYFKLFIQAVKANDKAQGGKLN